MHSHDTTQYPAVLSKPCVKYSDTTDSFTLVNEAAFITRPVGYRREGTSVYSLAADLTERVSLSIYDYTFGSCMRYLH